MDVDNWDDRNDWHPDYFECEAPPVMDDDPHLYADNDYPQWCNPHLPQLEHFFALSREYCRANHLPLLDDGVTFAAFCRALNPLNPQYRSSKIKVHMISQSCKTQMTG